MSIAAVVVTYNRKSLLMNCLAALLDQSRKPDVIYIIDNASTDGTSEMLHDRGYIDHPRIHYKRMPENLGGAGGFSKGMEYAFKSGFDYLWIMDDDVEPKLDALERMVPFLGHEDISALANLKVDTDGSVQYFHLGTITWNPLRDLVKPISPGDFENKQSVDIQFSSFVGLLVSSRAIERIGMPRSDFYIHCDDFEYCIRLLEAGKILLVPSSVIIHNSPRVFPVRKRFLMLTGAPDTLRASCMKYYGRRNCTWTVKKHAGCGWPWAVIWAGMHVAKYVLKATLFERDHYWTRLHVVFRAYWDGLTDRFDNDFPHRVLAEKQDKQV
ncbi:MAG: glycosyltransferase family 2 protein [Terracidiphilus sp.]